MNNVDKSINENCLQNIIVENRKKISITGVRDVLSFDDQIIILSTDLLELLNNVVEVASNLEFYNPLCGSPSILFKDITIAGKC